MASIQSTNDQITSKEAQFQETSDQLHDTEQKLNTRYDAMKKVVKIGWKSLKDFKTIRIQLLANRQG